MLVGMHGGWGLGFCCWGLLFGFGVGVVEV